jgi:hypothetical protein
MFFKKPKKIPFLDVTWEVEMISDASLPKFPVRTGPYKYPTIHFGFIENEQRDKNSFPCVELPLMCHFANAPKRQKQKCVIILVVSRVNKPTNYYGFAPF